MWWDTSPGNDCLRRSDRSILSHLIDQYDQSVLEDLPYTYSKAAFVTRRNKFNTQTQRQPNKAIANLWHLRLSHPGPQALEHLVYYSQGVRIKGPTTVEYKACGISKAKIQTRRQPRDHNEGPGLQLTMDPFNYKEGHNDYRYLLLIIDRWSGLAWDYYLPVREAKSIISALNHFFGTLEQQYHLRPKTVEGNNEFYQPVIKAIFTQRFIKVKPSAPNTPAQNGGTKRSGGVITEKIRAMRARAKFPAVLWPELARATIYLYNRTPKYSYDWKTPYDRFHTYLAYRDGIIMENKKPDQTHLQAYGYKAFALTPSAQKWVYKRLKNLPQ